MLRAAGAFFRATHPGPSSAVAVLAAILSWGFSLGITEATLVVLSVLLNQFSVGLSNDASDAVLDRKSHRSEKPLVAGEISPSAVWTGAIVLGVSSLALASLLHPGVLIAQAVFLAAGWLYNAGLKATVFSALAYAVGFGALPAIVSYAATPAVFPPWWSVLIAAGLGVAAHFGNVVPDRDDDEAHGVRGLPQRLPARTAALVLTLLIAAMSAVLVVGAGPDALLASTPAGVTATIVAVIGGISALKSPHSRLAFRASLLAALLLAAGLTGSLLMSG
jgi:4-hydroxybenzoate polyprenyltransferase